MKTLWEKDASEWNYEGFQKQIMLDCGCKSCWQTILMHIIAPLGIKTPLLFEMSLTGEVDSFLHFRQFLTKAFTVSKVRIVSFIGKHLIGTLIYFCQFSHYCCPIAFFGSPKRHKKGNLVNKWDYLKVVKQIIKINYRPINVFKHLFLLINLPKKYIKPLKIKETQHLFETGTSGTALYMELFYWDQRVD